MRERERERKTNMGVCEVHKHSLNIVYIPCLSNSITEVVSEEAVFNALVSIRIPVNNNIMTYIIFSKIFVINPLTQFQGLHCTASEKGWALEI